MNKKKIVIFHINSSESYYGEFHINTKLRMMKSYFKDVSHHTKFNFFYYGEICINEELSIKEITRGSTKYEIFFKVEILNENEDNYEVNSIAIGLGKLPKSAKCDNKSMRGTYYSVLSLDETQINPNLILDPNEKCNEEIIKENFLLSSRIKQLEEQVIKSHEENLFLSNQVDEVNSKLIEVQRNCDNLSNESTNSNKIIHQIRNEFQELEKVYNLAIEKLKANNQDIKFISNTNDKAWTNSKLSSNKRNSIELDKSSEFKKTTNSNLDSQIISPGKNKRLSFDKDSENKSKAKENGARNSRFVNHFSSLEKRKSIDKKQLTTFTPVKKQNSIINNGLTNNNPNKNVENGNTIIHSDDVILEDDSNSIEKLNKLNSMISKPKKRKSDKNSPWFCIIPYMTKIDQFNLCLTNKQNFKNVTNFWYDVTYTKLENINLTLSHNKIKYDRALEDQHFQLTASSNTALKLLNKSNYLDVFKSENNSNFENLILIFSYRLLLQFTKIFDDNLKINDSEFISMFKNYFIENTLAKSSSLGDFLKSLEIKCDLTDSNIEKVKEIIKFYNISTIDCGLIGKLCKTTGIISFFVKDALNYCGLDLADKKPKDKKGKFRASVIKDNLDIKDMKNSSEKIMKKLQLMNLILETHK